MRWLAVGGSLAITLLMLFPGTLLPYSALVSLYFVLAALLLGSRCFLLTPVFMFSPLQDLSKVGLFGVLCVLACGFSLLNYRKLRLRTEDFWLLALIFLLMSSFIATSSYPEAQNRFVTVLEAMIVWGALLIYRSSTQMREALLWSFFLSGAFCLVFKVIYVVDPAPFDKIIFIQTNDVFEGKTTRYFEGNFVPRLIYGGQEPNYESLRLIVSMIVGGFLIRSKTKLEGFSSGAVAVLSTVCMLLIYIQVVGSYSRAGFVAGSLVLLGTYAKSTRTLLFVVPIFTFATSYVIISIDSLYYRLSTILNSDGAGRFDLWADSLSYFAESPLWGAGFFSFPLKHGDVAHNQFLTLLAENGVIGLIVFLGMIYSFLFSRHRLKMQTMLITSGFFVMLSTLTVTDYKNFILYLMVVGFGSALKPADQPISVIRAG